MPPCTRTGCAGRGSMCEPHLEPGPASLRHPAARRHCRLGGAWRSAPGGAGGLAQGWAGAEHGRAARPAAARHAALPRLNWPRPRRVGTALPPPSKPPWLSPRQRAALCSPLLPARAQLHFQLLQTLAALAIRRLPPAGPAPPVPASLRAIPLKGCSCRLLSQSLVDSVWDEGWRLPARERRPLGSFPFAK